jgi:predicted transcriptional regulator
MSRSRWPNPVGGPLTGTTQVLDVEDRHAPIASNELCADRVASLPICNIYPLGEPNQMREFPTMSDDINNTGTIELTADVISAYVSNNPVPVSELSSLIAQVHQSLLGLSNGSAKEPFEKLTPAVPIKKSVTPEYIVCLDDGKKFKSLKRHLKTTFGITPDEYRAKWDLPADYPMVAPSYAATRSELAKKMGLGRKAKAAEPAYRARRKAA